MRTRALLAVVMVLLVASPAEATDLLEAWQAAQKSGLEGLAARQAKQAGDARSVQASTLWNTTVHVSGTAGIANSTTRTTGAQFSGPGFGSSNNIGFNTSVEAGLSDRLALQVRKPLVSGDRAAQQRSLELSAQAAGDEWNDAQQFIMLRIAERYFDLAQADEALRVLRRQQAAVEMALKEARDRFTLGATPVTDAHEAAARAGAVKAQVLAAETQVELARMALADATGLDPKRIEALVPARAVAPASGETLERWIADALARNPRLLAQAKAVDVAGEEASRHALKASTAVDLVAQLGREHINGRGDFGSASNLTSGALVGVQISVPLYTGGYRNAKQSEALSLAGKARTEWEQARQQVTQQTRAAWLNLTVGFGRLAALKQNLEAARLRLDATRLARQVGDRTTLDLLNAENDAAAAELAVVQAHVSLLLDRMRLAALAGGLDEAVLHTINASLDRNPESR
jgi:outer membrane protein